jgi:PKD repeat protein
VTYRLYVENFEGDRATAGELVPEDWSDSDHVVTVTVGSPDQDNDEIVNRNADNEDDDTVYLDNPPIAELSISPDDPIVGETVTLDGSASRDLEGGIVSYVWTVDGEQVATGESASWTPSESGVREIRLTVEDDTGQTDSESLSVYVGADSGDRNAPPNVRMNTSTTTLDAGESVTFNGSGSNDTDGNITEYRWDFDGDGSVDATGETIAHTYANGGIYSATLTVVDEDGSTNSTSVMISVEGEQKSEGSGGGFGGLIPGSGATPDTPLGLLLFLFAGGAGLLGVWCLDQRTERDIPTIWVGGAATVLVVIIVESLAPGAITIPLARALDTVGPLVWIAGIGGGIWLVRRWLQTRETEARASKLASWARRK